MQKHRTFGHAAWMSAASLLAGTAAVAFPASAQPAPQAPAPEVDRIEQIELRMSAQERRLKDQADLIERQRREIDALRGEPIGDGLDGLRAGQANATSRAAAGDRLLGAETSFSDDETPRTVGEAPPIEEHAQQVAAMPEQAGVLTPRGDVLLEPNLEFSHTSSNRLVYRGVEIVPGVQLGVIDANDADRNSTVFTLGGRYGLTNRLELEFRAPYVYRTDRLTILSQADQSVSRIKTVEDYGVGDIELALRYQLTSGANGAPIFIGDVRAKPPTGKGPYDVSYDEFGIATGLALGSGFWGGEAGLTMLYPTDPAVIYAGLNYNYNVPDDVNKTIGSVRVGRVDPGDSIGANLGFGLALNPRLSVSLGYSHNYVFPTRTQINEQTEKSTSIQVGSLLMGMSYRLDEKRTVSGNFEFGVTSDAPDVRLVIRTPLRY